MYQVRNIALTILRPHEEVLQQHVDELAKEILQDGQINIPILVDSNSLVILDGHHRYHASLKLGLKTIPCILIDYQNEKIVSLQFWRKDISVTKDQVIQSGIKGNKYPHKTTRHVLHINCQCSPTSLATLS